MLIEFAEVGEVRGGIVRSFLGGMEGAVLRGRMGLFAAGEPAWNGTRF
jgi:hypothetical protein